MTGFINIYKAYSHPNKILYNHINEIIWFSEELRKYGFRFNDTYLKILAIFHDLGKMYKPWQEYLKTGKNKIKHSGPSSVLFFIIASNKNLLEKYKLRELTKKLSLNLDLTDDDLKVLTYLILVHHSDLKVLRSGERTTNHYENFFTNFDPWRNLLKKYKLLEDYEAAVATKINIKNVEEFLDSYAVFKIADRISGSFHRNLREEEIPKILYRFGITNIEFELNEETLIYLLRKISNKEIDKNRLKDQMEFLHKGINILLAPTGFGKTTFSIFKGIHKNGRFLIALPTITAIKQFLNKTKTTIKEIGYFSDVIGTYFYFYNPFKDLEEDESLMLNEYFLSRYLLKPIMITTIDQLLLTYLQTKEYYIKRFALQNRLLIIDEVHLLSPKMLYFLLQFLKEYKHLFKDFVFMSATFPEFLREILQSELEIPRENTLLLYNYYPKERTWIEFLDENLEIQKKKKDKIFEKIYEKLKGLTKNKNSKIIVLFNTVTNAQEFYKYLKDKKESWDVVLFHSRYIYKHRKEKEKILLNISKTKKLKRPFITIATQVVEVSLDIDFDYLITELAPLPELIQRFGRVYRNRNNPPPKEPNIYIFGYFEESKNIYNEELMKESYRILKSFVGIVDEERLIMQLDNDKSYRNAFEKEFKSAKKEYSELVKKWLDDHTNRFYYLFIEEAEEAIEEISKLLNIRDSTNALVFVNEEDLEEKERKMYNKLLKILEKSKNDKNFLKFFKAKLFLREFLLSIPFYYIKQLLDENLEKGKRIPVLPSEVYSKEVGIDAKRVREKLEYKTGEAIIF